MLSILMIFLGSAHCWAAEDANAGVVNHVMAGKIDYVQGKGFFVTGPANIQFINPAGAASSIAKFATLDQLIFMNGTYKVDLKVIEDATGTVIAEASHNAIPVKADRAIQSFVTDWSLNAKAGLFTYQVVVNNAVIASFKIDVENAQ